MKLLSLCATSLLIFSPLSWSATYTVSDSVELREKMKSAKNGDTILIAPGVYSPSDVVPNLYSLSHTNGGVKRRMAPRFALINKSNITIKAANPNNKPKLRGTGIFDGRYIFYAQKANNLRLENIIFENARIAVVVDRSDNVKILNNTMRNTGNEAVHLRDGSDKNLIKGNDIYDVGLERKDRGEAIYICNDKKKWHPNYTEGKDDDIYQGNCDNTIIENNKIGPNIGAEHVDIKEGVTGTIIRNNTFYADINDGNLVSADGDFSRSIIHDKGHKSSIHNNTFDLKGMIWYNQSEKMTAIRAEQVLKDKDSGSDKFGHNGRYVYNTVLNGSSREFVVLVPSRGGNNAIVGCDKNGRNNRYAVISKNKAGLKINNGEGNTGSSVVSGQACDRYITQGGSSNASGNSANNNNNNNNNNNSNNSSAGNSSNNTAGRAKAYYMNSNRRDFNYKHVSRSFENGVMKLTLTANKNDPYVRIRNVNVNANTYSKVQFKVRNRTPGTNWKIFFAPKGGSERGNSVNVKVPRNGANKTFTVDMTKDRDWKGTIESIRLDPQGSVNGTVEIDMIKFVK